ncbi:MAG: helix-hairpin-helix domain-containing protein [Desulfobacterales bacterium]|jgi:competence protein ComEA
MKNFRKRFTLLAVVLVVLSMCVSALAEEKGKININTASADELEKLKQVGPNYAVRIIEYREKNGPFEKPEDIMKVKGIGPKTFELNKEQIAVE